jgi:thiol-disulfide isomerase/thioredoxin
MSFEEKYYDLSIPQYYARLNSYNNYFVDIGSSDGPGPIFSYLNDLSNCGLCIEGRPQLYDVLKKNINNDNVNIHIGFVNPNNIISIFQKHNVPDSPDILKLDIDSYDLDVLKTILVNYKPKIIIAEINEKIPLPIYFEVKYSEKFIYDSSHFYGFSLQAAKDIIEPFGYKIVCLKEGNNILIINTDYFDVPTLDIQKIYNLGYLDNTEIFNEFYWNQDVDYWQDIKEKDTLVEEITKYFTERNPRGKPVSRDLFIIK